MIHSEIISIGNELLNGAIVNNNCAYLSRVLDEEGFAVARQVAIGDHKDIILETIGESLACVPLVIVTGGLGPTLDDLTRDAVAELLGVPLEHNEELEKELQKRFGDHPTLRNQATIPQNALILPNPSGTASGLIFSTRNALLVLLPGVPAEMRAIVQNELLPFLKKYFKITKEEHETLHFINLYEAEVDPLLRSIQELDRELAIGIYPRNGIVAISLKGHKASIQMAGSILKKRFAEHYYKTPDGRIEHAIQENFLKKGWTLSLAESCTGGAIASHLTSIAGASGYFQGSVVAYTEEFKGGILHVSSELLQHKEPVSEEVAIAMACAIQAETKSTISLAITGYAGPSGGTPNAPIGTIFAALKSSEGTICKRLQAFGERSLVIDRAVIFALGLLYDCCKDNGQA